MVTLEQDALVFRFPEVHAQARLTVRFHRTLRVPDDGHHYPLPAGLGRFALRHVEDCAPRVPPEWLNRGGVLMPIYQSEAMWISFESSYPMAVKIAAGKINAVTGKSWHPELDATPQDYVTTPRQPWIDGFHTGPDQVAQFVASPLGGGETAEEQITGQGEFGGVQIMAYPLRADIYEAEQQPAYGVLGDLCLDRPAFSRRAFPEAMGLGLGGKIRQTIYQDDRGLGAWDQTVPARCFVHLVNSQQWQNITHEPVPHKPVTRKAYKAAAIPWFDYYDDTAKALMPGSLLGTLKTYAQFRKPQDKPDKSITPSPVVGVGPSRRVSEGQF